MIQYAVSKREAGKAVVRTDFWVDFPLIGL